MSSRRLTAVLFLLLCLTRASLMCGQEVDAPYDTFYKKEVIRQNEPMPYPFVREEDVLWSKTIWRTISLKEKANQFFYFPLEYDGVHGRKNLAYVIWDAILQNEIELYEDDEMKIPKDAEALVESFTRSDTMTLEIYDADAEEEYEYRTVLVPREFNTEDIWQLRIKESWFIDSKLGDQFVRITGLCVVQEQFKWVGADREYRGSVALFWIPMQSMLVRRLLARHEAYYEDNLAQLPTWDNIFNTRSFSSFITRISNVQNRTIDSYLTGTDAILESERIENELLNISLDMWEY